MKPNVWHMQRTAFWLGVAFLELGFLSPLSAQQANLRVTLQAPTYVPCVAFSPDGKILASGGADRTIRLWDADTGKETAALQGQRVNLPISRINSVAFAPDGKTLASGNTDRTVRLWDVATGKEIATLQGHTREVHSVAFTPDGKTLASGGDDTVWLWEVATGKNTAILKGYTGFVHSVGFSPDGKILATGSSGTFKDPGARVPTDNMVKLWDVATGREMATLQEFPGGIYSVAFSPDGKTLATGSFKTIKLWDVATRKEAATLQGHTGQVNCVAFSPDGRTLASGASASNEDRKTMVKLWDVATGKEIATLQGHRVSTVYCVAFCPDGKTLASGGIDKTVRLWNVPAAKEAGK